MQTQFHTPTALARAGASLDLAEAAMILLHGRGATAEDILSLVEEFSDFGRIAYLAPQARNYTWYPQSFLAPIEANEPFLSSALGVVDSLVGQVVKAGISYDRVVLLGFSQGACLALEYVARHARRYGGLVGLSGGLIGPEGTSRDYPGPLNQTPVYLGCSDIDPHIPLGRVKETEAVLARMGARVTTDIFPRAGHMVLREEIQQVRALLSDLLSTVK